MTSFLLKRTVASFQALIKFSNVFKLYTQLDLVEAPTWVIQGSLYITSPEIYNAFYRAWNEKTYFFFTLGIEEFAGFKEKIL